MWEPGTALSPWAFIEDGIQLVDMVYLKRERDMA